MPWRKAVRPLTVEEHEAAAALVRQVQELLSQLAPIGARTWGVRYVDEVLRVQRQIQQRLIDPPREYHPDPYPSVGYHPGTDRRLSIRGGVRE